MKLLWSNIIILCVLILAESAFFAKFVGGIPGLALAIIIALGVFGLMDHWGYPVVKDD
jgi:hypothetical protein